MLSDRYADSTLAYQGYGYQTDMVKLKTLVEFATGGLVPDLTIFFDLDVEEGLRRRLEGGEWNRLDALDLAFYQARCTRGIAPAHAGQPRALGAHGRLGNARAGTGRIKHRGG